VGGKKKKAKEESINKEENINKKAHNRVALKNPFWEKSTKWLHPLLFPS
jgi:hypothetical protein